jgi:ribonucleoside-diphosphate reductase alpha chain
VENTCRDRLKWLLDTCCDLKDEPEYRRIKEMVEDKIYFSRIKSIAYGKEKVYDLYIPQTNSFLGNGLVNHNTINFSNQATIDDVRKSYLLAYELGCKGITIYRDKSREEQVLNVGSAKPVAQEAQRPAPDAKKEIAPRPRPEVIIGTTTKVSTGCGNLYVTINVDEEGKPFELFTQMGKAGGCAASQLEALGRLVSLAFRAGIEVKAIIEQLRNIRCPSPSWEKGQRIFSCADAIARVVEKRLVSPTGVNSSVEVTTSAMKHSSEDSPITPSAGAGSGHHSNIVGVCPDCGGALRHEEGCSKCHACGYSKC